MPFLRVFLCWDIWNHLVDRFEKRNSSTITPRVPADSARTAKTDDILEKLELDRYRKVESRSVVKDEQFRQKLVKHYFLDSLSHSFPRKLSVKLSSIL